MTDRGQQRPAPTLPPLDLRDVPRIQPALDPRSQNIIVLTPVERHAFPNGQPKVDPDGCTELCPVQRTSLRILWAHRPEVNVAAVASRPARQKAFLQDAANVKDVSAVHTCQRQVTVQAQTLMELVIIDHRDRVTLHCSDEPSLILLLQFEPLLVALGNHLLQIMQ